MSDIGRYRRVYPRTWKRPTFVDLNDGERVLMFYLLTGPQTNRIGLYSLSIASAAEDLKSVPDTIRKRLRKVCATFGWHYDADARVFYIPSWWHWNPPENANVLKGNLKDLIEIPPCGLVDAFARNVQTIPETLHQTFVEELRQRLPTCSSNQEQYQKQKQKQEQEQEQEQQRTLRLAETAESNNAKRDGGSPHDVELAREILEMTNPNEPIEELVDGFLNLCRFRALDRTRANAVAALTMALAERRLSRLISN